MGLRRISPRLVLALCLLGIAGSAVPSSAPAALSSVPDSGSAAVNGTVNAIVRSSTRTYVGGNFAYAGIPTIGSGGVSASTGLLQSFARVTAGTLVSAVISDGAGGFYIGGSFSAIAGQAVANLAHIKADGTLDTAFLPNPDGAVGALALSGSSLLVAGSFATVGGRSVARLASLDAATGAASASFAPTPDAAPSVLLVSGTTLYAGGAFTTIGGQGATPRLARMDIPSGAVDTDFVAAPSGAVSALAKAGSALYVGGTFSTIGGQGGTPNLAQVDAATGAANVAFTPSPSSQVNALAVSSDGVTLFAAGTYITIGGQTGTPRLTKLNPAATTRAASVDTTWAPTTGNAPTSLALSGGALYVGGNFGAFGTPTQLATADLAKIDPTTAVVDLAFKPVPTTTVSAFAISGSSIYVGGAFTMINGLRSNGLAALMPDGAIDRTFAAGASSGSAVNALALSGSDLYVGGTFSTLGGQSITNLTRLNAATGTGDTSWKPTPNGAVNALVLDGAALYAGGAFSSIGGQSATARLARLDTTATTTAATVDTTWVPFPNSTVSALALSGTTLYAGGGWSQIGGQSATPRLAKLDTTATTNAATVDATWVPSPNSTVSALVLSGTTLYAGGSFTTIGAQAATPRLAKLATATGTVDTAFAPAPNNTVAALARTPATTGPLYVGGSFVTIGGQDATSRLAKVDPATGVVDLAFAPLPQSTVNAISAYGGVLSMGGAFTTLNGAARQGYAQLSDPVAPTITFTSTAPTSAAIGDSYTASATGGSSSPVVFSIDASSTASACSVSGSAVSLTGAGTCVVDADQAADAGFAAAAQAQQSFVIAAPAPPPEPGETQTQTSPSPEPAPITVTVAPDPPAPATAPTPTSPPAALPAPAPVPQAVAPVKMPGEVRVSGGDQVIAVACAVAQGSLESCALDAYANVTGAAARVLVGHGERTLDRTGVRRAQVEIVLNDAGRRLLVKHGTLAIVLVAIAHAYGSTEAIRSTSSIKIVAPKPVVARRVRGVHGGFAVGSSALTPALRSWVKVMAKRIHGLRSAVVTGFTQNGGAGASRANLALGRARAMSVAKRLRADGYHGRIVVRSAGQRRPARTERSAAGRAANRRVEIRASR